MHCSWYGPDFHPLLRLPSVTSNIVFAPTSTTFLSFHFTLNLPEEWLSVVVLFQSLALLSSLSVRKLQKLSNVALLTEWFWCIWGRNKKNIIPKHVTFASTYLPT